MNLQHDREYSSNPVADELGISFMGSEVKTECARREDAVVLALVGSWQLDGRQSGSMFYVV